MSVGNLALGGGGILVTLFTFWLGYRQTIGAKQERIRTTNAEIEATLLKRVLLGQMKPSFEDLSRFVAGKAVAARVGVADLRPINDLIALLWTRVVENDLIPPKQRESILKNVFPIEAVAREISPAPPRDSDAPAPWSVRQQEGLLLLLGVVAAGLGTAFAAIPILQEEALGLGGTVTIFAVALAVVAFPVFILLYRAASSERRPQDQPELADLTTYPDRSDGREALKTLQGLTPLAVASFTSLATDEERCMREGGVRGLFVRTGGTPWHKELVDAGLVEVHDPPQGVDPQGREFVVLTETGKAVARVILAKKAVPGWLATAVQEEDLTDRADGKRAP